MLLLITSYATRIAQKENLNTSNVTVNRIGCFKLLTKKVFKYI